MVFPGKLFRAILGAAMLLLALCIAAGGTVAYLIAKEGHPAHSWRAVGDLDALGALAVLGAACFPLATVVACRLEGTGVPRLRDHFRQSALLYVAVAIFLSIVWPTRGTDGESLGFAVLAMMTAGAIVGIALNAMTLGSRRAVGLRRVRSGGAEE